MKLLLKLALAAAVINACWHLGSEYLTDARFREATNEAALEAGLTEPEIRQRVMDVAEELDVPLEKDDLLIAIEQPNVVVSVRYQKAVQVFPGFEYPWTFSWTETVYVLQGALK